MRPAEQEPCHLRRARPERQRQEHWERRVPLERLARMEQKVHPLLGHRERREQRVHPEQKEP